MNLRSTRRAGHLIGLCWLVVATVVQQPAFAIRNLKVGDHELIAVFTGKGPHTRDYRRGATMSFNKGIGAKYLELEITDRVAKQQPEFEIKEWE